MYTFKVEIRKDCLICGGELPKRFRTYCSTQCRNRAQYKKEYKYRQEWQRAKRAEYADNKIQCRECGGWFVQVVSHVIIAHQMDGEEYRKEYNLPLSRGVIPRWYRQLKGDKAIENKTYKNLEKGSEKRYIKGDPRAKSVSGLKGKFGGKGFTDY